MKQKKGFTLVEVLGVVIVICIIALITVPAVLSSIEKARKAAFKDSVFSAFGQVEYYMLTNNMKEVPKEGIEVVKLNLKNNSFISGILVEAESGNLKAKNVSDGVYCAIGEKDNFEVYDGACDLTTPTCELTSKEQVGVRGWYAFNPTIVMHTMAVNSGFLNYGIGLKEDYSNKVEGVGKIGTAEYKTTGDSSLTVYCYVENVSGTTGKNQLLVSIDKTAPTEADFTYTVSGKNLTIVASGTDTESGIAKYQFSIDNGVTWTNPQSSNTYTYTNLKPAIYSMKVRVYNGTYVESKKDKNLYKESNMKQVSLIELIVPTYTFSPKDYTSSNVDVTVHFEKDGVYLIKTNQTVTSNIEAIRCSSVLDGKYTCDLEKTKTIESGVWYQVMGNPTLTFTENGSVIAQVSDGINYKTADSFSVSNIDRVQPVAYAKLVDSQVGSENWYRLATIQVGKQNSGLSGIKKIYYCTTTGSTCTPNVETTDGKKVSIVNNNVGQRVCSKVISSTDIESTIVCSEAYKVDNVPPTATFSLTGVTCNDNYAINPAKAGTTWTLSGTANITKTYQCADLAGNVYDASRTYTYSSCLTGSNTCSGGFNQEYKCNPVTDTSKCLSHASAQCSACGADYNRCKTWGSWTYQNCYSTAICNSYKDTASTQYRCVSSSSCDPGGIGAGAELQKRTCSSYYYAYCTSCPDAPCTSYGTKEECGYVNTTWNPCKTGSNTCKGGFK